MILIRTLRIGAVVLIAAALIGGAYAGCCRQRERTPDYALVQIARAVQTEDRALFEQYVDTEAVLAGMHEDAAALIADNIDALHERHPSDWFFRHDAAFLRAYMAERRTADIAFARMMLDYYFDDARVPVTKEEGRARWASDEMRAAAAIRPRRILCAYRRAAPRQTASCAGMRRHTGSFCLKPPSRSS